MITKVIKDKESYKQVLNEIGELIINDPLPSTEDADKLELLTLLAQDYESKNFPIIKPNPIDAIKFRMEQRNLSQTDLIAYIGSRSKVSEVLSGKRPLSLAMIRALHTNLGIPAEILLQENSESLDEQNDIQWDRFPIKEMISRKWIQGEISDIKNKAEEILKPIFAPFGKSLKLATLYKTTNSVRSARSMDKYALAAWSARVLQLGLAENIKVKYKQGVIDLKFMQEVAKLSIFSNGPILAQEFLAKHGIALVVESHLPQTYLDGAAIMVVEDRPIIGLSLRYDRIDNFWFTLMHELAHISRHYGQGITHFYDDLDIKDSDDPKEREADDLAEQALIPNDEWESSPAKIIKTPQSVELLANKLRIHPGIVAGRLRREYKQYNILNNFVGHGKVRILFGQDTGGSK